MSEYISVLFIFEASWDFVFLPEVLSKEYPTTNTLINNPVNEIDKQ